MRKMGKSESAVNRCKTISAVQKLLAENIRIFLIKWKITVYMMSVKILTAPGVSGGNSDISGGSVK